MKKIYKLDGLDCAHCAGKMEERISKLDGVKSVVINFMTTKLTLETEDDNFDAVFGKMKTIINELEPDVNILKA